MDNEKDNFEEDRIIASLPQFIQDRIPIIRESVEKYQGEWTSEGMQSLFTEEFRKASQQSIDLRRIKYKQELVEIGFTPDLYRLDRIDFPGDYMREYQFYFDILGKKVRITNRAEAIGYTDFFESVFFGLSVICNKYRVVLSRLDENNDFQSIYDPKNPEDQKIFDMIEVFMNRRGYERIETELLNIPLPIRGELYGIPTDISGCQTDGPFTVRHLLFGE